MAFRLLSCDGGGVRGYISSSLIARLNEATNGKLLKNIDGFSGNSTGSLISIGLGVGVNIETLVCIYRDHAAEIFTPNKLPVGTAPSVVHPGEPDNPDLRAAGFLGSKYTFEGLKRTLSDYLGDRTFGDINDTMIAVNAARLWNEETTPARWTSETLNTHKVGSDYTNVRLADAAMASAAAPIYFPPHAIPGRGFFADGGVFANNPVLDGVEVALEARLASDVSEIEVISFGTGFASVGIDTADIGKATSWGSIRWLWPTPSGSQVPPFPIINMMLQLTSQNIGNLTALLLGDRLIRINPVLERAVMPDQFDREDYEIMDKAIADATASPAWERAKAMVENW
ncbi:patatin-like phospholipase family protein [Marimonas sp. MJW-29]|uniref:Patatin-like phospholipase family protein n=1 Tax=Sulfitobacter sediminis TaxID=3234186 RepID=A0ABV3RTI3_9RHOB